MSKRAILGVAGVAYGGLVLALAPVRQAIEGWRAVRSLGESLNAAMDAIAAETNDHINETAGKIGDNEGSYPS